MEGLLRIGELARTAGVSTRTVDYYTGLGLLEPVARTEAGYRLYHPAAVTVIGEIRQLESHGVSLDEIGHALSRDPADVSQLLDRIAADLATLRTVAESAAPHAQALLAVISARAHSLLAAAVEIAAAAGSSAA